MASTLGQQPTVPIVDVQQGPLDPEPAVDPCEGLPGIMGELAIFASIQRSVFAPSHDYSQCRPDYPKLIERLKRHIYGLRHRTDETRKAFKKVEKTVEKMELKDGQRETLMKRWYGVQEEFEKELRNSTKDAIEAHDTIGDFLKTIVPYLQEEGHKDSEKLGLLASYRQTVIEGKERVTSSFKSFDKIGFEIKVFKGECAKFTKEVVDELERAMKVLQEEINQMTESVNRVIRGLVSLFKGLQECQEVTSTSPHSTSRKKRAKELEIERNECRRKANEAEGQNDTVVKNADELISHVTNFADIWRLIEDNVNTIENKLFSLSRDRQVFYQRLSTLPGQYVGLKEALDLYAAALSERVETPSSDPKPSWMKFNLGRKKVRA